MTIMNESNLEIKKTALTNSFFGFKLSDNIAIGVVPPVVYTIIFAAESGYFSVFN
jgi:hypothetical protein